MTYASKAETIPKSSTDVRPAVSIGLPVYNGEKYLEGALDSILKQTFEDFELVICDNCSTDATESICRKYARRDSRVRYFRNERNSGAASNFRLVFERSRGKLFRWACYDDLLEPECIEACVEVLDANPNVILAFPDVTVIDEDGVRVDKSAAELYLTPLDLRHERPADRFRAYLNAYYPVGGKCNTVFGVIRRDVLGRTALIADYVGADKILLGELSLYGRFHQIDRKLFLRRDHPQTSQRAHASVEALADWLRAGRDRTPVLPHWLWLRALILAVLRSPISVFEKIACLYHIGRHYVRHTWRPLIEEARRGLGYQFRRSSSQASPSS